MSGCYVIGICGRTCSGKTTASKEIKKMILTDPFFKSFAEENMITVLSQDWWYKGGNVDTNYDIPLAVDFEEMVKQLKELISGKEIDAPDYDFSTHSRKSTTQKIKPSKIIVIEGILIFSEPELKKLCDLKVFVSAPAEVCYQRRIDRDTKERGRDVKEVINRYMTHVLNSAVQFVDPSEYDSDITLKNNSMKNTFTGLDVLKNHIKFTFSEIMDRHTLDDN